MNSKNKSYNGYNAIFTRKDRNKTILIPWFTDFLSPMIPAVAKIAGYNFVNCPKTSKQSAEMGLKFGHNEVCYPATLVLGDLIAEIQTGRYNIEDLAVAITQTGGQCRATNYLSFIKTGLKNAGYGQIPVISVSVGGVHQNEQPGFKLPIFRILPLVINAFLFGDSLNQIFASAVARERIKGQSERLFDKYMQLAVSLIEKREHKKLLPLLQSAVAEFDTIDIVEDRTYRRNFRQIQQLRTGKHNALASRTGVRGNSSSDDTLLHTDICKSRDKYKKRTKQIQLFTKSTTAVFSAIVR